MISKEAIRFTNARGQKLAGVLHWPADAVRGWVLYAPCFTCSKDIPLALRMADALAKRGYAVLRFDPTGLGESEGRFEQTDFDSEIDDILRAAAWLKETHAAPQLLIGHSLGGVAILEAAVTLPETRAVVTLGTPASLIPLAEWLQRTAEQQTPQDRFELVLGGQTITLSTEYIDSLRRHDPRASIGRLRQAVLILHAPEDNVVPYADALALFAAAKEPRGFASLDEADHLLRHQRDVEYCAQLIAAWALRPLGLLS